MKIKTCVFDAYGTLFDVVAAARTCAAESGQEALQALWPELAETWRLKQLQYTWWRAITNKHTDFWQVTQGGLDYALEEQGLEGDAALRERLLELYWQLAAYPEVASTLQSLREKGYTTAILSNGSPAMLQGAVESAGISALLDAVLSVEAVGVFKPHDRVYQLVTDCFECQPQEVVFVSSNGWDAAAAAGYGFSTIWVNRKGEPVDRLPSRPAHILSDLSLLPEWIMWKDNGK